MNSQDFWNDIERTQKVNREIKSLRNKVDRYKKLVSEAEDIEVLIELALEENDDSVTDEVKRSISILDKEVNAYKIETLLNGPYDRNNAIVSLHAGAGGTEAMDWGSMLGRMYNRGWEDKG